MKNAREQWRKAEFEERMRRSADMERLTGDVQRSISEAMAAKKGRTVFYPKLQGDLRLFRKYLTPELQKAEYFVREIKFLWLFPVAVEISWTWLIP